MSKETQEQKSEIIARAILAGQPIPEGTVESLMKELCEEYKEECKRGFTSNSKTSLA